jgi:DNA cross-link repair 1A protein
MENVKHCLPLTTISVDSFKFPVKNCNAYFLTHFHSDHYTGLNSTFDGLIYCSLITAKLVIQQLHVDPNLIQVLCLDTKYEIQGVTVTAIDANQ